MDAATREGPALGRLILRRALLDLADTVCAWCPVCRWQGLAHEVAPGYRCPRCEAAALPPPDAGMPAQPRLLGYTRPDLRADLWDGDGFDPFNPDHISEDPDRALIMQSARQAKERGITRAEAIASDIIGEAELLDVSLGMVDLIDDPTELRQTLFKLRELLRSITRTLARHRARRVLKREGGSR